MMVVLFPSSCCCRTLVADRHVHGAGRGLGRRRHHHDQRRWPSGTPSCVQATPSTTASVHAAGSHRHGSYIRRVLRASLIHDTSSLGRELYGEAEADRTGEVRRA